ncbi:MAG TPA: hypothetical protein VGK92_01325 [Gaiellales bacterium]
MDSPEHRRVILTPELRLVGLGLATGTYHGERDVTLAMADFSTPSEPPGVGSGRVGKVPRCVNARGSKVVGIGDLAGAVGKGLFAGAAGTAAMTVSSTLEAKLRGREPSFTPSDAAGKVLGVQPRNPEGKARFSNVVHWTYGTSWGAARGLLQAAGLDGQAGTAAHFAAVWGSSQAMLPSLKLAPPAWDGDPVEVAIDAFHHLVYAVATGLAFAALEQRSS